MSPAFVITFKVGMLKHNLSYCSINILNNSAAPKNLQLVMNGSTDLQVMEGEQFTFNCTSDDSVPMSKYRYGKLNWL